MRFQQVMPAPALRPYIRHYVLSEQEEAQEYKVLPVPGLVMGLQYRGHLSVVREGKDEGLAGMGITGLTDSFRLFRNSPGIGTMLVYFTETGLAHFSKCPAHELFNLSVAASDLFERQLVADTQEALGLAANDQERIAIADRFFLAQLRDQQQDRLVDNAVQLIYQSKGVLRISALNKQLHISQSPLEKRFRQAVGCSPKKFASMVRFNAVLQQLHSSESLAALCYDYGYFDQAHFIRDFKQYTGQTPEQFRKTP
jgi:AraC-like DNA-binding protein